ncbi:MAG: cysteine desulfurase family protein [Candidatus Saccharimonadales bacterium]
MNKKDSIYLDYAATTPVDSDVLAVMEPYWQKQFYNPSSLYRNARSVKTALEEARGVVAKALGAKPLEVIFTAGATESINLAIAGVLRKNAGNIVVCATEHEAVLSAAQVYGREVKICPVKPSGIIDLSELKKLIDSKTVLVSVAYANNEVGTIQPMREIGKLIEEARNTRKSKLPLYFHSDATQAANYLSLDVSRLGVDLMTLNGSKIYGPKQTGCLYVRAGVEFEPLIYGGGQEKGRRSGTENVPGFIGFAHALKIAQDRKEEESRRQAELRTVLLGAIETEIANIHINGTLKHRLPNNLNITIPNVNGETLVHHLDAAGVMASTGSACSANNDKPSHVLLALGLSIEKVNSSLRLSLGRFTTQEDIKRAGKIIAKTVHEVRSLSS